MANILRESERSRAINKVNKAIRQGDLIRPKCCELCGNEPGSIEAHWFGKVITRSQIAAHHWNGYNNPIDVWWICHHCNCMLKGHHFHCGYVSKHQARLYIKKKLKRKQRAEARRSPPQGYKRCKGIRPSGMGCNRILKHKEYCNECSYNLKFYRKLSNACNLCLTRV